MIKERFHKIRDEFHDEAKRIKGIIEEEFSEIEQKQQSPKEKADKN
ncbi:MAG: hypothetical protein M1393_00670 [Candidatus Thermoplasmatota archaeon]|jgi:hypothetical protein|nr:hypothetical protein [Candidatus Thermoplasmatota archaeon]MCL6089541.1 hypothetical protein [Candidatus Thermoplasmatota archaeon]MDA8142704.1 hypothetical protein [Thermoplasmatales archaeon]